MVEVFKTNVTTWDHANRLIDQIHHTYREYKANFDLEDCDRILRVQSSGCPVECGKIIQIVRGHAIEISLFED